MFNLLLIATLAMAAPATDKLLSIEVPDNCTVLSKEFKKWIPESANTEKAILQQENIKDAVALMDKIPATNEDNVDTALTAIKEDTETSWNKYSKLAVSQCPALRMEAIRILTNTAMSKDTSDSDKILLKESIRKAISAPKFSNFINASIDSAMVEYTVEKGLFSLNEDEKKNLETLRDNIRKEIEDYKVRSAGLWEKASSEFESVAKAPESEQIAFMKTSFDWQKVKPFIQGEADMALNFLKETQKSVSALK